MYPITQKEKDKEKEREMERESEFTHRFCSFAMHGRVKRESEGRLFEGTEK